MVETLQFTRAYVDDLDLGVSSKDIRLQDGSLQSLRQIHAGRLLHRSAYAALPTADGTHGVIGVSDTDRALWLDVTTQWASLTGEVYNVALFGAKGDDSTDDTAALQAAFDAAEAVNGTVVIPPGIYRHTGLTLAPSSGQISVSIVGLAPNPSCVLKYVGTLAGTSLTIKNNVRFEFANVQLRNGNAAGNGVGLLLSSLASGSSTGSCVVRGVRVENFATGITIGEASGPSVSELTAINVELASCTTGMTSPAGAAYTTNINLVGLMLTSCTTGVNWLSRGGLRVRGGSATSCTTVFKFQIPYSTEEACGLHDYFSELHTTFLQWGPDSAGSLGMGGELAITGCTESTTVPTTSRVLLNALGSVYIAGNKFGGRILLDGRVDAPSGFQEGTVVVCGNGFAGDPWYNVGSPAHCAVYAFGNIRARTGYILADEIRYYDASSGLWTLDSRAAWQAGTPPIRSFDRTRLPRAAIGVNNDTAVSLNSNLISVNGVIDLIVDGANYYGRYQLRGSSNAAVEIDDPQSAFTVTEDNAGTFNIYYHAGSGTYRLQNKSGTNRTVYVMVHGV